MGGRRILGFMSVTSNLERIGDLSVHVARMAQRLAGEIYVKESIAIPDMAERVARMVSDSVATFCNLDTAGRRTGELAENKVDDTYSPVFPELLTYMYGESEDHQSK